MSDKQIPTGIVVTVVKERLVARQLGGATLDHLCSKIKALRAELLCT